jgi:NADPH:quinone reductase-like Zn-dependent oxidoreductase
MKAVLYHQYGSSDVLELGEVEKPSPKPSQVLVKIKATALNSADAHLMSADPFVARFESGLFSPKRKILGADIAGIVESVGSEVKTLKVGDEVFGDISSCGFGGLAEYVAVPETALVTKPANISFEEAAASGMAAGTALQGLRDKGKIQAGQQVIINGASGGVGTFAVQLAKYFGAEVTAVCSTKKIDLVRSLGADHVIDYTKENFTQSGKQFDLIFAANGYHPIADYKRALKPNGIYVMAGGRGKQLFEGLVLAPFASMGSGKTMTNVMAVPKQDDLRFIRDLLEICKIRPVIDKTYPLSQAKEAMRYLSEGHAAGKIIVQP